MAENSKPEDPVEDDLVDRRWAEKNLDSFGEYCFETDQLALKGNEDYQNLIRTLSILEGQKIIAVKNMEKLISLKEEALKDPLDFVKKLQRGETIDSPLPQSVAEVPEINWSKYGIKIPHSLSQTATNSNNNSDNELAKDGEKSKDGKLLVRGREFNSKKPETFNQLWTPEEQKRLEELLITYPPEQIEMERWRKIAKALGNRTPLQVQSRVQKYFIKLQKAGLPVPGRTYNFANYSNFRKNSHRHQRHNRFLFPSSSFFSTPPVFMNDVDDGDMSAVNGLLSPTLVQENIQVSDEEDIPECVRNTDEYLELQWLKLLQRVKLKQGQCGLVVHIGYKCDHCGTEPIRGTRWHCYSCPSHSVDICDRCVTIYKNGHHQPNHKLTPVLKAETDQGASYLQSNFLTGV